LGKETTELLQSQSAFSLSRRIPSAVIKKRKRCTPYILIGELEVLSHLDLGLLKGEHRLFDAVLDEQTINVDLLGLAVPTGE